LLVLLVLTENETEAEGKQSPRQFIENGKAEKVPVNGIIRRGDIALSSLRLPKKSRRI
jgi:hypothetical protein